MTELLGVLLFVLVTGSAVLWLLVMCTRGLLVLARQRRQARALAAARGWRFWAGVYSGQIDGHPWQGQATGDSDGGEYKVEFSFGLAQATGVEFSLHAARTPGGPPRLQGARWATVLTPAVVSAWATAAARPGGALTAACRHHFVIVERAYGAQEPGVLEVVAHVDLGVALSQALVAALKALPAHGADPGA